MESSTRRSHGYGINATTPSYQSAKWQRRPRDALRAADDTLSWKRPIARSCRTSHWGLSECKAPPTELGVPPSSSFEHPSTPSSLYSVRDQALVHGELWACIADNLNLVRQGVPYIVTFPSVPERGCHAHRGCCSQHSPVAPPMAPVMPEHLGLAGRTHHGYCQPIIASARL
jgi:hypothetical protein